MHNLDKWLWDNYGTFDFYQLSLLALLVSSPYPLSCFALWVFQGIDFDLDFGCLFGIVWLLLTRCSHPSFRWVLRIDGWFCWLANFSTSRSPPSGRDFVYFSLPIVSGALVTFRAGSVSRRLPICFNTSSYFTGRLDCSLYFGEVQWTSDEPVLKFWHFWSFDTSLGLFDRLCD